MLSPLFSVFSASLLLLSHLVHSAPLQLLAFAPTITSPSKGEIWMAGTPNNVSWLTNNIPDAAENYTLTILLGHVDGGSEHLNISHPLATQVPIKNGSVMVNIPSDTPTRYNYAIAVIGDSGDLSPPFTILNMLGA